MNPPRSSRTRSRRLLACAVLFTMSLSACAPAEDADGALEPGARGEEALTGPGWTLLQAGGPAPIRSIIRRSDGMLLGPRSSGHEIEVWASTNDGASWFRRGSVANNPAVDFGDVTMLRVPGTVIVTIDAFFGNQRVMRRP